MAVPAPATGERALERDWWLRALAVLVSPRAVFAWFRSDSPAHADARAEPVLALVLLAGIAAILSLDATGSLLDWPGAGRDPLDPTVLPVVIFVEGSLYGVVAYWLGGLAFHLGLRGAGAEGSFRRARHLLAYAAMPLLLGLVLVWPVKLALYGLDAFRTDASDFGAGARVFEGLSLAFVAWSVVLLVVAVRTVFRWSVVRAVGAFGLAALALVGISLVLLILSPR